MATVKDLFSMIITKLNGKANADHVHSNYVDLTSAQTINGTKTFNNALFSNSDMVTGGKQTYNDGVAGIVVGDSGRLYLSGTELTPALYFYHNQTASGANILYNSSNDYMYFAEAARYTFDNNIVTSGDLTVNGGDITVENSALATAYTNLSKI